MMPAPVYRSVAGHGPGTLGRWARRAAGAGGQSELIGRERPVQSGKIAILNRSKIGPVQYQWDLPAGRSEPKATRADPTAVPFVGVGPRGVAAVDLSGGEGS